MTSAPDAEALTLVHQGWDHLKLQRPLAAWACYSLMTRRWVAVARFAAMLAA